MADSYLKYLCKFKNCYWTSGHFHKFLNFAQQPDPDMSQPDIDNYFIENKYKFM